MELKDKKPNNPQAFPSQLEVGYEARNGMTLRDYFAAKAMQGIIQQEDNWGFSEISDVTKKAYQIADKMLKQRKK